VLEKRKLRERQTRGVVFGGRLGAASKVFCNRPKFRNDNSLNGAILENENDFVCVLFCSLLWPAVLSFGGGLGPEMEICILARHNELSSVSHCFVAILRPRPAPDRGQSRPPIYPFLTPDSLFVEQESGAALFFPPASGNLGIYKHWLSLHRSASARRLFVFQTQALDFSSRAPSMAGTEAGAGHQNGGACPKSHL